MTNSKPLQAIWYISVNTRSTIDHNAFSRTSPTQAILIHLQLLATDLKFFHRYRQQTKVSPSPPRKKDATIGYFTVATSAIPGDRYQRFGSKHMRNGLIVNRLSLPEWIAGFKKEAQVIHSEFWGRRGTTHRRARYPKRGSDLSQGRANVRSLLVFILFRVLWHCRSCQLVCC